MTFKLCVQVAACRVTVEAPPLWSSAIALVCTNTLLAFFVHPESKHHDDRSAGSRGLHCNGLICCSGASHTVVCEKRYCSLLYNTVPYTIIIVCQAEEDVDHTTVALSETPPESSSSFVATAQSESSVLRAYNSFQLCGGYQYCHVISMRQKMRPTTFSTLLD